MNDIQKMVLVRNALHEIIEGKYPILDEEIEEEFLLSDEKFFILLSHIIKTLSSEVDNYNDGRNYRKAEVDFFITKAEQKIIKLPNGDIGISTFARAVNSSLVLDNRKKITGASLNKALVKKGILEVIVMKDGKRRTVLTNDSAKYGIFEVENSFNGAVYNKIVYNNKGKKFLLDNLNSLVHA